MGAFFALLFQKAKTMAAKSPAVFALFCAALFVTVSAFLFFFGTIIKSRSDYIKKLGNMRTVSAVFSNFGVKKDGGAGFISKLEKNGIAKIDGAEFRFKTSGGKNKETVTASLYPEKTSGGVYGRAISTDDIKDEKNVMVAQNGVSDTASVSERKGRRTVGQKLKTGGIEFYVKGVRFGRGDGDEIPYSTAFKNFRLSSVSVTIPANLTDFDKQKLANYLYSRLGASDVTMPKPVKQEVFESLFIPFVMSVFIGIIAVVNFAFLFSYMTERCREDFTLLRLCGASRKKSLALQFALFMAAFTAVFLLSAALIFSLKILKTAGFAKLSIGFSECAYVYLLLAVLIVLSLLPTGLRYFKKPLIEDERELN